MPTQLIDSRGLVLGRYEVIALEAPLQLAQQTGIVFNDKEFSAAVAQCCLLCNCGWETRHGATLRVRIAGFDSQQWTDLHHRSRCLSAHETLCGLFRLILAIKLNAIDNDSHLRLNTRFLAKLLNY